MPDILILQKKKKKVINIASTFVSNWCSCLENPTLQNYPQMKL